MAESGWAGDGAGVSGVGAGVSAGVDGFEWFCGGVACGASY